MNCSLGDLALGNNLTVTITVTPTQISTLTITNTLGVGADVTVDPTTGNNSVSQITAINPVNLVATLTDWPDPALSGAPLTYTLLVTNTGPAPATGLRLTDTLPVSLTPNIITTSQGNCTLGGPIVCNLDDLGNGNTLTITLVVTPTLLGTVINLAQVTANEPDLNPANNLSTQTTLIDPADLRVTKVAALSLVKPNQPLTYTLLITNTGPAAATGLVLTDTLPSGVTFSSAVFNQGSCTNASSLVICPLGSLAAGSTLTGTLIVTPTLAARRIITNTVTVTGNQPDPVNANNTMATSSTVDVYPIYLPWVAVNHCQGPFYADNFSNFGSGWPTGDNGSVRREYLNGEYRVLLRPTGAWIGSTSGFKQSNYIATVEVRNATGFYGTYGLVFGLAENNWSQFYTFEIDLDGYYVLWRYSSGSWNILAVGFSGSLHPGIATNRLKLERNGTLIKAYANGQLLVSFSDSSFTGLRRVGLIVSTYNEHNVDARFDNLAVYPVGCQLADALSLTNETFSAGTATAGQEAGRTNSATGSRKPSQTLQDFTLEAGPTAIPSKP